MVVAEAVAGAGGAGAGAGWAVAEAVGGEVPWLEARTAAGRASSRVQVEVVGTRAEAAVRWAGDTEVVGEAGAVVRAE